MENKISIAELLKDCPKGMELDCITFDAKVTYQGLSKKTPTHPIIVQTEHGFELELTRYGQIHNIVGSKCIIFPKGKTTWEGFHRPFKDGDILTNDRGSIFIYKGPMFYSKNLADFYCGYRITDSAFIFKQFKDRHFGDINECRFATEEEKLKLFQTIKDNGHRWNTETKTLEKLVEPEFNVGDWIIRNNKYTGIPVKVVEFNGYYSCELNGEVVNLTRNDVHNNFHLWTIDDARDGDVLASHECLVLFKKLDGLNIKCYCTYHFMNNQSFYVDTLQNKDAFYPATTEQCDLLFQKIKETDYKWNPEIKSLEKLVKPKFENGDIIYNQCIKAIAIFNKQTNDATISHCYLNMRGEFMICHHHCKSLFDWRLATEEEQQKLFDAIKANSYHWNTETKILEKLIKPKFKVGDTIQSKEYVEKRTIQICKKDGYWTTVNSWIRIDDQDKWELVPNKFDITNLKPFDKVLVRCSTLEKWRIQFFEKYDETYQSPFICLGSTKYNQCVPYKGNEYLLNTTDDCNNFYKTWK